MHDHPRTPIAAPQGPVLGSPVVRADDAPDNIDHVKAAEFRVLAARLRIDAETCRELADEAYSQRIGQGPIVADYAAEVSRHYHELAGTAERYADRAGEVAADYEDHSHPLAVSA
jgi:hypothetical protein